MGFSGLLILFIMGILGFKIIVFVGIEFFIVMVELFFNLDSLLFFFDIKFV